MGLDWFGRDRVENSRPTGAHPAPARSNPGKVPAALGHEKDSSEPSLVGRRFLLVTAPFGPFARILAGELRAAGAHVSRMIFSGGDAVSWGLGPGAIPFRRPSSEWGDHFEQLADGYTDIIVFGESGPYNHAVLSSASKGRRRTWVLENGYFRPNWITIEQDGVNWNSSLPRIRSAYDHARPPEIFERVGPILPYHVWNISVHHLLQLPGRLFFPHFRFPYFVSPWRQGVAHAKRYLGLKVRRLVGPPTTAAGLVRPYFLACLQRDGDSQLLAHSAYKTNIDFLDYLIRDFSRFAPANTYLVIKNHPLDPGLVNLKHATSEVARRYGMVDRVTFLDDGLLAELCRGALGLIVNNSTAGLAALEFRTPVKVLGRAFFDFEGLTDQKPLRDFWSQPQKPDPDLVERFRYGVIDRVQVHGSFHAPASVGPTARRLTMQLCRALSSSRTAETYVQSRAVSHSRGSR